MFVFFLETLEPGVPRDSRRLKGHDKDPPLNSSIMGNFLQGGNFGCFASLFPFSLSTKPSNYVWKNLGVSVKHHDFSKQHRF